MNKSLSALVVAVGLIISAFSYAHTDNQIDGLWRHAEKPAKLSIDSKRGLITLAQHENNREAEGLTVIKDISAMSDSPSEWSGQMYNGYIGEYVSVQLTLRSDSTLVVTDIDGKEVLRLHRDIDGSE